MMKLKLSANAFSPQKAAYTYVDNIDPWFVGLKEIGGKVVQPKKLLLKMLVNLTPAPTFYVWLFRMQVSRETFLYSHYMFKLFWYKNIGTNALIKCW
jgi:hypothetical protein